MRARELKQARTRLEMSQTALAEALGMSRSSVAQYEAGTQPIPKVVALAIEALEARETRSATPRKSA